MAKIPLTKVLIVDDDEDILKIAKYSFDVHKEIEVKLAGSGREAIDLAQTFLPDIILLDLLMPKMDGPATLEELRKHPKTTHIPVIFFTASVQKDQYLHFRQLGALEVIYKPFNPLTLPQTVQTIWKKYTERD